MIPVPLETPLNWRKDRDSESEARARKISTAKIEAVFAAHDFKLPEIALYLELGEACPFGRWWECEIWLDECERLYAAYKAGAAA